MRAGRWGHAALSALILRKQGKRARLRMTKRKKRKKEETNGFEGENGKNKKPDESTDNRLIDGLFLFFIAKKMRYITC